MLLLIPVQRLFVISLLALTVAAPTLAAAPMVSDALNGFGTAITFHVYGEGLAFEGGTYAWNDVCGYCYIRMSIADGSFVANTNANLLTALPPGLYEVREFRGLFQYTEVGRFDFDVEFHGVGKIARIQ